MGYIYIQMNYHGENMIINGDKMLLTFKKPVKLMQFLDNDKNGYRHMVKMRGWYSFSCYDRVLTTIEQESGSVVNADNLILQECLNGKTFVMNYKDKTEQEDSDKDFKKRKVDDE